MHTITKNNLSRVSLAAVAAISMAGTSWAQSTTGSATVDDEDVIVLSPFEVSAEEEQG